MREMKKVLLVVISELIVSLVASLCAVEADPIPSVPQFTLKFEAHPYYVPPVHGIDQYSGKNITIEEGYYVENRSVEISIKNQLYYNSINGSNCWIVYNVRVKGHYGEVWNELYWFNTYTKGNFPLQSNSESTVISVSAEGYPSGSQIDIQVKALAEYSTQVINYAHIGDWNGYYVPAYAINSTSDWSNTQTITIPENSPSPSPSSSPSPTITPTPSPTLTPSTPPSLSPTQEPITQHSPSSENTQTENSTLITITIVLAAVATISIGIAVYALRKLKTHS
jgi:hypothetical protein